MLRGVAGLGRRGRSTANSRTQGARTGKAGSMREIVGRPIQKAGNQAPISIIWFSALQASEKTSSGACRMGCGLASRARQSNDFGWCAST